MKKNYKKIHSRILKIVDISEEDKYQMLSLMKEFYDNVCDNIFYEDLKDKDYSIILYNNQGFVKGFSTQREVSLKIDGKTIYGIFSGDTIIHKDYWGSLDLYKEFARKFVTDKEDFYWFLISKGYKTYKMLPIFFKEFYPNYKSATPSFEKKIINSFGEKYYPKDYDGDSGVIKYKQVKDKLKTGVADITQKHLKDKDIEFFTNRNSNYINGDDLVCIAKLHKDNLKNTGKRLLRGV